MGEAAAGRGAGTLRWRAPAPRATLHVHALGAACCAPAQCACLPPAWPPLPAACLAAPLHYLPALLPILGDVHNHGNWQRRGQAAGHGCVRPAACTTQRAPRCAAAWLCCAFAAAARPRPWRRPGLAWLALRLAGPCACPLGTRVPLTPPWPHCTVQPSQHSTARTAQHSTAQPMRHRPPPFLPADILLADVQHDPSQLRGYLVSEEGGPLFGLLIKVGGGPLQLSLVLTAAWLGSPQHGAAQGKRQPTGLARHSLRSPHGACCSQALSAPRRLTRLSRWRPAPLPQALLDASDSGLQEQVGTWAAGPTGEQRGAPRAGRLPSRFTCATRAPARCCILSVGPKCASSGPAIYSISHTLFD